VPLTARDRTLLTELLAGRSGSWKSFVDRFAGLVVQVIRHTAHAHSLKLNQDDIDDLCADTWAELLSRDMAALRGFRGRCSLATYMAVIVRRIVVRKLTQHRFRTAMGHVNAHQAAIEQASAEPPAIRQIEAADEVETLMQRLPSDLARLARLFYLDQLSYREIAERLSLPVNSIGPMLSRLRQTLSVQNRASR
jgi:RNA polymerase sigma-70 factor (ECF subfamily)